MSTKLHKRERNIAYCQRNYSKVLVSLFVVARVAEQNAEGQWESHRFLCDTEDRGRKLGRSIDDDSDVEHEYCSDDEDVGGWRPRSTGEGQRRLARRLCGAVPPAAPPASTPAPVDVKKLAAALQKLQKHYKRDLAAVSDVLKGATGGAEASTSSGPGSGGESLVIVLSDSDEEEVGVADLDKTEKTCPVCQHKFSRPILMRKHYLQRHITNPEQRVTPFRCNVCQRYFLSNKALGIHKSQAHVAGGKKPKVQAPPTKYDIPGPPFVCPEPGCAAGFRLKTSCINHYTGKHGDQGSDASRTCDGCRSLLSEIRYYKDHVKHCPKSQYFRGWIRCNVKGCEFKCSRPGVMRAHKIESHDKR